MSTEENADDHLPFMDPFDAQQRDEQRRDEQLHNERIQSPHDRLINQTLQQIDAARALLSQHLPSEIAEHLLFETLASNDASFIDANLRRRFADRLFKVDVSTEIAKQLGMKVNYVYIFVLIDHKGTDEPHTLVQMLGILSGFGRMHWPTNSPWYRSCRGLSTTVLAHGDPAARWPISFRYPLSASERCTRYD